MTTRWKLTIEYDGSGFSGWQKQSNAISVQQVLEGAIHSFSGETVSLHTAGRTDAGVHALAQIAHFDLKKEMEPHAVSGALNFFVRPHRVVILKAEIVDPSFHARFNATQRSYRYLIDNRAPPLALMAGRAWHFVRPLTLAPMQEAAKILIGHHDFTTFRASGCQAKSPMRTLDHLEVSQKDGLFVFETAARSFLYHQVRNMVGSLARVGTGQWSLEEFADAFAAADREMGGQTAPPDGLYFCDVKYL